MLATAIDDEEASRASGKDMARKLIFDVLAPGIFVITAWRTVHRQTRLHGVRQFLV